MLTSEVSLSQKTYFYTANINRQMLLREIIAVHSKHKQALLQNAGFLRDACAIYWALRS